MLPVSVKGVLLTDTAVTVAPLPLADDLALPAGYRRSIERVMKQANRSTGRRTNA